MGSPSPLRSPFPHFIIILLSAVFLLPAAGAGEGTAFDYKDAVSKSLLFFEAQRSGRLPYNQRVTWRGHSGLTDGLEQGVDLVGGYYDAGDQVKFGLPMAFTITMLAWSAVEYGEEIAGAGDGEFEHTLEAIKWGTDYFVKAHTHPDVLWAQVGDGATDHYCWQRPEDMTTPRRSYKVDAENPGSELAGETAAALAAASIAFEKSNAHYSHLLLHHAQQLFEFGDKHRGNYDKSVGVVKGYYPSVSGYGDELLWAALWLHRATGSEKYLEYIAENAHSFGGAGWAISEFSWDIKYAGVQILAAKVLAIKKIDSAALSLQEEDNYLEAVSNMSRLRHPNITTLLGYCVEHGQRLLVYEYIGSGTLHDMLHYGDNASSTLTWNARVRVALGTARALEYLHEVCLPPVVHRNFKSANILLDEELNPHLADCGLAALTPNTERQISTEMVGSFGYSAPEFAMSGVYTVKSDVYSFGVVMLELLTGRKPLDSSRSRSEQSLVRWATPQLHDIDALAKMVDPTLNGMYPAKSLSRFADIIALCVQSEPEFRPPMSEVVQSLVRLMQRASIVRRRSGDDLGVSYRILEHEASTDLSF